MTDLSRELCLPVTCFLAQHSQRENFFGLLFSLFISSSRRDRLLRGRRKPSLKVH